MKDYVVLSLFLIVYFFLPSCLRKNFSINERVNFDTIRVNEFSCPSRSPSSSNLCANLTIDFIYPKKASDPSTLKVLQNFFVKKFFGESFCNLTPQKAIKEYSKLYFREIGRTLNQRKNLADEVKGEYYFKLKNRILYQDDDLLSFVVESISYEGGIHPSRSVYGYVFDLSLNQLLNEDQFAGASFFEKISAVLVQKIMKKKKCKKAKELENLGYNLSAIVPNNNFTLDKHGITYYFNEYEIAAYFLGITKIFIPYKEINAYVSEHSPLSVIYFNEREKMNKKTI